MSSFAVSVSPHIWSKTTTSSIMRDVLIALIPALIASVFIFGTRPLLVTAVCVATAVISEWVFEKATKRPVTISDLSAAVTGTLLAFSLPADIPIWQAVVGAVTAIIVIKQLFGGIGQNFANPAAASRVIMLLAFSGPMTQWRQIDAITGATPLALIKAGDTDLLPSLLDMFLGNRGGCIGEVCVPALIAGGIYLLARRIIQWHTPVVFIATAVVLTALLDAQPLYQLMSGGLLPGAIFMATDYSTTPSTVRGRVIFGFGCGLITVLIRVWGSYPEGVSFSILLMNIITPYISRWTRSRPFGGAKA
ncbi:MAG: RnfABCDGE type electron transport complex subunit D [Clostridiales bacterium]|nr:RnfABCDGE type electron transport complex subunit D [Clostridiales bacterium]